MAKKLEEREIKSDYVHMIYFSEDNKRIEYVRQLTGKFQIFDDNTITGKIAKRYWSNVSSDSYSFGAPSQIVNMLKKDKVTCVTAESIKSSEQSWIDGTIEKIKRELIDKRKAKFMDGLKSLLKETGFSLNVSCEYGGWGEAWAETIVSLTDKVFNMNDDIAYIEGGNDITIEG